MRLSKIRDFNLEEPVRDFSNCIKVSLDFPGVQKKSAIIYDNKLYMVKFNERLSDTEESYHCVSEYIASKLCEKLNIPCQKVLLGIYGDIKCCAIEMFTGVEEHVHSYFEIGESSIDSTDKDARSLTYDLSNILEVLTKYNKTSISVSERLRFFWNMLMVDTIIGNFDRHWGNWGFIVGSSDDNKISPIYDNGSSLFPRLSEKDLVRVISDKNEMRERVLTFPTSQIRIKGKKSSYKDLVDICRPLGFDDIVSNYKDKIEYDLFRSLVKDSSLSKYISLDRKEFLSNIMYIRYKVLVEGECFDGVWKSMGFSS